MTIPVRQDNASLTPRPPARRAREKATLGGTGDDGRMAVLAVRLKDALRRPARGALEMLFQIVRMLGHGLTGLLMACCRLNRSRQTIDVSDLFYNDT